MNMQTLEPITNDVAKMTDADLLAEAKAFVLLRKELEERGERLSKVLSGEVFLSRSLVFGIDGAFYEIQKVYSPSSSELPVRVMPVTLLTGDR